MSLTERTTDDRLDDLLEAIEKQTAATNRASMQAASHLSEIEKSAGLCRRYLSVIYIFFFGALVLLAIFSVMVLAGMMMK